ncbi:MAG: radical SAM protein [Candidatus Mcinerneyibacterium aminivorans]|uniref:Radical SAM protein n=1 Tax=Candidatus Mcinerneyibacterium aminivorans TaxID=2703815 RepID=A0A5D0MH06_9BACT|nr:MAG: radical SAM protein [Candidatus Mcinerneyibacterium aminivorans]
MDIIYFDPNLKIIKEGKHLILYSPNSHSKMVTDVYFYPIFKLIKKKNGVINKEYFKKVLDNKITKKEYDEFLNKIINSNIFFKGEEDYKKFINKFNKKYEVKRNVDIKQVYIHLTHRCNFNCSYCYNKRLSKDSKGELNTAEWKQIIKKLVEKGIKNIIFTGGEPLLRFDLEEIGDMLKV